MCGCCGCVWLWCGEVGILVWDLPCLVGGLNTLISTAISDGTGYGDIEDDSMMVKSIDVVVLDAIEWWFLDGGCRLSSAMRNAKFASSLVVRFGLDSSAQVRCCRLCEVMNALWVDG